LLRRIFEGGAHGHVDPRRQSDYGVADRDIET